MAEFDFFSDHKIRERYIIHDALSCHPAKENIPDDDVIPPENAIIALIIIATLVDVPNHPHP